MPKVTTSSAYSSWGVKSYEHTYEELKEYVDSLEFNTPELRQMTVSPPYKHVVVNGLGGGQETLEFTDEDFDNIVSPYKLNGENEVTIFQYYADRGVVVCEYHTHPLDPVVRNTQHDVGDFGNMFSDLFTLFKTCEVQRLEKAIADKQVVTEFNK